MIFKFSGFGFSVFWVFKFKFRLFVFWSLKSVSKFESKNKGEGIYSMAFLNTLGTFIVFLVLFLLKHDTLTFSTKSVPLVLLLIVFEYLHHLHYIPICYCKIYLIQIEYLKLQLH